MTDPTIPSEQRNTLGSTLHNLLIIYRAILAIRRTQIWKATEID